MTLWPRSLFGRLMLLLVAVVALVVVTTALLFGHERSALIARQFNDTKLVEVRALRAALEAIDPAHERDALDRLERDYHVHIVPEEERPHIGLTVHGAAMRDLEERLREGLGAPTEVRIAPRRHALFVHLMARSQGYWIGFALPPPPHESVPTRALTWALVIAALLLVAAFAFARYLARPLRELKLAVDKVGRGEAPPVLPESGTSEIAAVNRGFNAMLTSLRQSERDRALLLAGVSHDLRTPLARLRLGIELHDDDAATHAGMVADIEEMDRIIGQFLDFARDVPAGSGDPIDVAAAVAAAVERYRGAGRDVACTSATPAMARIQPASVSRIVANLVDNALAYGAPPVEVSTRTDNDRVVIDVADRGPGIATADVERLKQPFTRAGVARSREDGAPGAGLGLAIVERIARLHGGRLDLLERDGGGTVARVTLAAASPAFTDEPRTPD